MSKVNKNLFNTLNNYDYSEDNIKIIKEYLKNGSIPTELNTNSKINKFKERYDNFEIKDDNLFYKPLNLEVIPEHFKHTKLQELYDDFKFGAGASARNFYYKIIDHYLNITRQDVSDFVNDQAPHQITTHQQPRRIDSPKLSPYPNYKWACDLIDMSIYSKKNKGYNYILTVIDHFSKYCFAVGLKNKKPISVKKAFELIYEKNNVLPNLLLSDNGLEFKGVFSKFCNDNNIKQMFTKSHSPTDNALCENLNKFIRKIIREVFIRTNKLNWIDYLDDVVYNRNHSKQMKIKEYPYKVWTNTKQINKDNEIQTNILNESKEKNEKLKEKYKEQQFEVNDKVRFYLPVIDSSLRKSIKQGDIKKIVVLWSPTIYKINKVININKSFGTKKYYIVQNNNENETPELISSQPFKSNELQLVKDNDEDIDIIPSKLNLVNEKRQDINIRL
jgi:hypothetical protein